MILCLRFRVPVRTLKVPVYHLQAFRNLSRTTQFSQADSKHYVQWTLDDLDDLDGQNEINSAHVKDDFVRRRMLGKLLNRTFGDDKSVDSKTLLKPDELQLVFQDKYNLDLQYALLGTDHTHVKNRFLLDLDMKKLLSQGDVTRAKYLMTLADPDSATDAYGTLLEYYLDKEESMNKALELVSLAEKRRFQLDHRSFNILISGYMSKTKRQERKLLKRITLLQARKILKIATSIHEKDPTFLNVYYLTTIFRTCTDVVPTAEMMEFFGKFYADFFVMDKNPLLKPSIESDQFQANKELFTSLFHFLCRGSLDYKKNLVLAEILFQKIQRHPRAETFIDGPLVFAYFACYRNAKDAIINKRAVEILNHWFEVCPENEINNELTLNHLSPTKIRKLSTGPRNINPYFTNNAYTIDITQLPDEVYGFLAPFEDINRLKLPRFKASDATRARYQYFKFQLELMDKVEEQEQLKDEFVTQESHVTESISLPVLTNIAGYSMRLSPREFRKLLESQIPGLFSINENSQMAPIVTIENMQEAKKFFYNAFYSLLFMQCNYKEGLEYAEILFSKIQKHENARELIDETLLTVYIACLWNANDPVIMRRAVMAIKAWFKVCPEEAISEQISLNKLSKKELHQLSFGKRRVNPYFRDENYVLDDNDLPASIYNFLCPDSEINYLKIPRFDVNTLVLQKYQKCSYRLKCFHHTPLDLDGNTTPDPHFRQYVEEWKTKKYVNHPLYLSNFILHCHDKNLPIQEMKGILERYIPHLFTPDMNIEFSTAYMPSIDANNAFEVREILSNIFYFLYATPGDYRENLILAEILFKKIQMHDQLHPGNEELRLSKKKVVLKYIYCLLSADDVVVLRRATRVIKEWFKVCPEEEVTSELTLSHLSNNKIRRLSVGSCQVNPNFVSDSYRLNTARLPDDIYGFLLPEDQINLLGLPRFEQNEKLTALYQSNNAKLEYFDHHVLDHKGNVQENQYALKFLDDWRSKADYPHIRAKMPKNTKSLVRRSQQTKEMKERKERLSDEDLHTQWRSFFNSEAPSSPRKHFIKKGRIPVRVNQY